MSLPCACFCNCLSASSDEMRWAAAKRTLATECSMASVRQASELMRAIAAWLRSSFWLRAIMRVSVASSALAGSVLPGASDLSTTSAVRRRISASECCSRRSCSSSESALIAIMRASSVDAAMTASAGEAVALRGCCDWRVFSGRLSLLNNVLKKPIGVSHCPSEKGSHFNHSSTIRKREYEGRRRPKPVVMYRDLRYYNGHRTKE